MRGHYSHALQLSACSVNLLSGVILRGGEQETLTTRELECLSYLARRAGLDVSREELLEQVWHYDPRVISRTVDVTVRRLRKKLEARASHPEHLLTVHGAGYRLEGARFVAPARPGPAPTLLGRAALLDRLRANRARMLTLIGPPGIGKSQLARALAHDHEGTVLWVDLAQVGTELDAYLPMVLNLRAPIQQAFPVLFRPLLVLDDAQAHIQALTPLVQDWLQAAPELRILCTSRTPLGVEQQVVSVGPLDPDVACTLLGGSDPSFRELAQALDHNPLALTLAREPCALLGAQAVLERLGGQGDVFGRGQSVLDAAVMASWRLLTPDEQRVLALASLGSAGLPLQVLEHCAGPKTLAAVQGLLRSGLLTIRTAQPSPRIEVPFPVAPFARRMSHPKDAGALQRSLAWWGTRQMLDAYGDTGESARANLLKDAPALLEAARGEGPAGERCLACYAAAMQGILESQTLLRTVQACLAKRQPTDPVLAVQIARTQRELGQFDASRASAVHGLSLEPEPYTRLSLLDALAFSHSDQGESQAAQQIDLQAQSLQLQLPAELCLSWSINRANRLRQAGSPEAIPALKAAWVQASKLGSLRMAALAASHLASIYTWSGNLEDADALLIQAINHCKPVGEWEGRGVLLQIAANLALSRGRLQQAESLLWDAEATWRALGRPSKLDKLHLHHARIAVMRGLPEEAIAILSAGLVSANNLTHPRRSQAARLYRGMLLTCIGQLQAGLRDLEEADLTARPALLTLQHTTRMLTLLRLGNIEGARQEQARAPDVKLASLAHYQALAHAGMNLMLGDAAAHRTILRDRAAKQDTIESIVLWSHLDWVLEQHQQTTAGNIQA